MEMIQAEVINLLVAVLTALAGLVTAKVSGFLKKKGVLQQLENNKEIVRIVVTAVEQMYEHLDGDEKLHMAKVEAVNLLHEKNIKISEEELSLMIESIVKEMKESYESEVNK